MTQDQKNAIKLVVANDLGYSNEYVPYARKFLKTGKIHPRYLVHFTIESIFAGRWITKHKLETEERIISERYSRMIYMKKATKYRQLPLPFCTQKTLRP